MGNGPQKRSVKYTSAFKKDIERGRSHKKCDWNELTKVMTRIEAREPLDEKHRDHFLRGRYPNQRNGHTDCRECHTSNDWLLVYRFPDEDTVHFIRCGTHSDLF